MIKVTNSINNDIAFCEDEQEFLNSLYECAQKSNADITFNCDNKPTYMFSCNYIYIEFYIEEC